jgi:hypothetical protein
MNGSDAENELTIYDDLSKSEIDNEKWKIVQFPSGENEFWTYSDPNAEVEIKNNTFMLRVNPFTKKNESVSIFDNPKHLFYSTSVFKSPDTGEIIFECDISTKTFNNDDNDLRDAFGSFHIMDFKNGMVIDFIGNNKKLGVIYERLLIPSVSEEEAFTDVIELRIKRKENRFHKCRFAYNKSKDEGRFYVEGKEMFRINEIPVKVEDWVIGIGVCTLDRNKKPLHGQGAEVKVKNIKTGYRRNSN